jgi:hypothetical protein
VHSFVGPAGVFIGQEAEGKGGQWVACAGGPGDVRWRCRARRPCSRAGRAWSRRRGAVGRCWRGQAGRQLAERKRDREGGPGGRLPLLHFSRLGSGQRGLGSTTEMSTSMATGFRRT